MSQCPKGQICLKKDLVFFCILIVIIISIWISIEYFEEWKSSPKKNNKDKYMDMDNYYYLDQKNQTQPQPPIQPPNQRPNQTQHQTNDHIQHHTNDHIQHQKSGYIESHRPLEYITQPISKDQFIEPQRPVLSNTVPINIPTRGYNTQFSQIGILHNKNKKKGNIILPLYGKQLHPGSNKWQYYVSSDSIHSIKLDIKFKNKSGLSEYGCEEISDKDIVGVPSYRQAFVANIYNLEKPMYIPYIN
jgi:hypothetical protein